MFQVECEATVDSGWPISDDAIDDLIERVVDSLDEVGAVDPSVGTDTSTGVLRLRIEFIMEVEHELIALEGGVATLHKALDLAGVYGVGNLRPSAHLLAPA